MRGMEAPRGEVNWGALPRQASGERRDAVTKYGCGGHTMQASSGVKLHARLHLPSRTRLQEMRFSLRGD